MPITIKNKFDEPYQIPDLNITVKHDELTKYGIDRLYKLQPKKIYKQLQGIEKVYQCFGLDDDAYTLVISRHDPTSLALKYETSNGFKMIVDGIEYTKYLLRSSAWDKPSITITIYDIFDEWIGTIKDARPYNMPYCLDLYRKILEGWYGEGEKQDFIKNLGIKNYFFEWKKYLSQLMTTYGDMPTKQDDCSRSHLKQIGRYECSTLPTITFRPTKYKPPKDPRALKRARARATKGE